MSARREELKAVLKDKKYLAGKKLSVGVSTAFDISFTFPASMYLVTDSIIYLGELTKLYSPEDGIPPSIKADVLMDDIGHKLLLSKEYHELDILLMMRNKTQACLTKLCISIKNQQAVAHSGSMVWEMGIIMRLLGQSSEI